MSVTCPYCQNAIKFKGVKAGRFTPKCPGCTQSFSLTVSEDGTMTAAKLPAKPAAAAAKPGAPAAAKPKPAAPSPEKTQAAKTQAPAAPPAKKPIPAKADPDVTSPESTGAWQSASPEKTSAHEGAASEGTGVWQPDPADPNATSALGSAAAKDEGTGVWQPEADDPDRTSAVTTADPDATSALERAAPAGPQDQTEVGGGKGSGKADDTAPGEPKKGVTKAGAKGATKTGAKEPTKTGKAKGKAQADEIPKTLDGYEVIKQLGQGGMGTVYLARQVSLDRSVALKVMNPRWAQDPAFLARFTREAYAAAQLTHHNIIQIYDIGSERDIHFFSMEFVRGQNLGDLVKEEGKLDPEVAAGYVLQAARGLKFAHDQGMVHRDIKPDNLMLNDQSIVKVADLGLVKVPGGEPEAGSASDEQKEGEPSRTAATGTKAGPARSSLLSSVSDVTQVGSAMGTPTYMAPEQGRDAANVDHRADIYSLGCTLYAMVTGRPPFQGKTALEVMTKHMAEPLVRPEAVVKRVPKEIGDIVVKMMAKKPEDRYPDLGAVIRDLEKFLGVQSTGPFTPKEEHANTLEEAVKAFNAAPAAKLRVPVALGFLGVCALLFLICAFARFKYHTQFAAGVLVMAFLTPVCAFVVGGITYRTHLFTKVRELVLGSSWIDWLTMVVGVLIFLAAVWFLDLFVVFVIFSLLSVGLAFAFHLFVERQLTEQREEALEKAEKLLKSLRLKGLEEEALQQFVCKYSGDQWEELFEELFGYEGLLKARQQFARPEGGRRRSRHATWRDPIIVWIEARQEARRQARERNHLEKIEQKELMASGLSAAEARAQARLAAEAMVGAAAEIKQYDRAAARGQAGTAPRRGVRYLQEARARSGERRKKLTPMMMVKQAYKMVLGPKVRFLVGAALLAGCLLWYQQNKTGLDEAVKELGKLLEAEVPNFTVISEKLGETKPLQSALVPGSLTDAFFDTINPGVAGLILILSALCADVYLIAFLILGALVTLLGRALGVPPVGPLTASQVSLAAGLGLVVVGYVVSFLTQGRERVRGG